MRQICEDKAVEEAVTDAILIWGRADEAWDAIVWTIARDPFGAGPALTESGMTRMIAFDGARSIDMPAIKAIYVVSRDVVTIMWVEFSNSPHLQIGNA